MKNIACIVIFFTCIFFGENTAFSAGEVNETGTVGMSFLKITPSAQISSLGGGSTAYANGPSSIWSNPALAAAVNIRSVQLTHIEWVEGIKQEFVTFSTKTYIGNWGFSFNLFDSGDIDGRDSSGKSTGTYSMKNAAVSLFYATQIKDKIALGFTFKKLFEKISMENASGFAVDFGITTKTPIEGISLAFATRNNGRMGVLRNERTKLPSDICFGTHYQGTVPGTECLFVIVGDYIIPKYGDSGVRFGMETEPINNFFLRIGYRSDSDIQDVSFGVGVKFEIFSADVAYTPMKEGFDNVIRLTLGLSGF